MPEPVTLVVGGLVLYALFKGQGEVPLAALTPEQRDTVLAQSPSGELATQAPITIIPSGALVTSGSVVAADQGVSLGTVMLAEPIDTAMLAVPSDLVAALDASTALMFRQYAALNPTDFEAFLDRYADRIVLRNDLMIEMLEGGPPEQGFEVSPGMLVGMGTAAYKVVQGLNGVAAGKSFDVFGISASVAGQIPGINADFVSSLQGLAMGYRAITSLQQVMTIAAANNVGVMSVTGSMTAGALTAYPGLAALQLAGVLMAVGLVVDIAFTIIGDKPDLQKAIDVALDVASLAVLFIPGIGIVIAIVIQLVKFIIDLFGEELFGGGMSHEQREMLEAARYGENLNPMFPQLADCYTPRELFKIITEWGSGYCGGVHVVAMSINLVLKAGDRVTINGVPTTIPEGMLLGLGKQPCYWLGNTMFDTMTDDEQAWALGAYAPVNGIFAMAQVGISDWRKEQFNDPVEKLIMARAQPMHDFLIKHRLSLNEIDQIALEYRAQPHLNALASSFSWASWQEFFASIVSAEWHRFNMTVAEGSLSDFARQNGYPTMYAFRAAALGPWEHHYQRAQTAILASARIEYLPWFTTWYLGMVNAAAGPPPTYGSAAALTDPVIQQYVASGMTQIEAEMTAQWFANMSTP